MGKVKETSKVNYPSVKEGVRDILKNYLIPQGDKKAQPIYSLNALNDILGFLIDNNIPHQYMIVPAPAGAVGDELISLGWDDGRGEGVTQEAWYSKGKSQKFYHINLTIKAEDEDVITNWIINIDEVGVVDWSVTEL